MMGTNRCFRKVGIPALAVALACCSVEAQSTTAPAAGRAAPLVRATRQPRFAIPFSLDRPLAEVAEVRLFVSDDGGKVWRPYSVQPPSAGRFVFSAPSDGVYWFCSQTVDRRQQLHPSGPPTPELIVYVDSQAPELNFRAQVQGRQIVAQWSAADATMDPQSLKVEYRTGSNEPWRVAPLQSRQGGPGQLEGEAAWGLPDSREIELRAEVRDAAGNRNVVHRQLMLPREAVASQVRATAPAAPPGGPPNSLAGLPADPLAAHGNVPRGAAGGDSSRPLSPQSPNSAHVARSWATPTASQWPSTTLPVAGGSASLPAPDSASNPAPSNPGAIPAPTDALAGRGEAWPPSDSGNSGNSGNFGNFGNTGTLPKPFPLPRPAAGATPAELAAFSNSEASSANSGETQPDVPSSPAASRNPFSLPDGVQAKMTNRTRLSLDYEVEAVAGEELAEVELWGTEDGGQTWTKWGGDPDRRSPMTVKIEREGAYGFRVVAVSSGGLTGEQPFPGAAADVWIGVDTSPPLVKLQSALPGQGAQAGRLEIKWLAEDANLGRRPIELSYGAQPSGPWTTIVTEMENLGQYLWAAGPEVPGQVYLKLAAQDEAGNRSEHVSAGPVSLAGLKPRGRIRTLQPIGATVPETAPEDRAATRPRGADASH